MIFENKFTLDNQNLQVETRNQSQNFTIHDHPERSRPGFWNLEKGIVKQKAKTATT